MSAHHRSPPLREAAAPTYLNQEPGKCAQPASIGGKPADRALSQGGRYADLDHGGWAAHDHPAYLVIPPKAPIGLPLVIDLPHSHAQWPHGMATAAAASVLGSVSDAYVDQFWLNACQARAPLLLARFHRALIDANRAPSDIDPQLLCTPWPGTVRPSIHSIRGVGLIRRWALPGIPIHDHLLTVADVETRIAHFYEPYHQALAGLINQVQGRFGHCLHISAQAMKPVGSAMNHDPDLPRPDFVVSHLNGLACAPALTAWVVDLLRSQGFEVWVNSHYMGAELIRRHAQPLLGRHGLQIEINQALYLDETTRQPGPSFNNLARVLQSMLDGLAANPQRLADLCLPGGSAVTEAQER